MRASDTPPGQAALALDLTLSSAKPPALHGDAGLSRKSALAGNASYYVSYTRLAAEGALTLNDRRVGVSGQSWMDHEFGTTGLGPDAIGWDWFSLQLNDGRELMLFQIRQKDGSIEPLSSGTLVARDGSTRYLANDQFRVEVGARWKSPRTGGDYPARWKLSIPSGRLALAVVPFVADQEMDISFKYWEGAVRVEGQAGGVPIGGTGYVELTGYGGPFLR